jgi:hypothetical protein
LTAGRPPSNHRRRRGPRKTRAGRGVGRQRRRRRGACSWHMRPPPRLAHSLSHTLSPKAPKQPNPNEPAGASFLSRQ